MTPKVEPPKDLRDKIEEIVGHATNQWDDGNDYTTPAVDQILALFKLQQEALLKDIAKHQKFANDCELCTHNGNYLANKLRLEL